MLFNAEEDAVVLEAPRPNGGIEIHKPAVEAQFVCSLLLIASWFFYLQFKTASQSGIKKNQAVGLRETLF